MSRSVTSLLRNSHRSINSSSRSTAHLSWSTRFSTLRGLQLRDPGTVFLRELPRIISSSMHVRSFSSSSSSSGSSSSGSMDEELPLHTTPRLPLEEFPPSPGTYHPMTRAEYHRTSPQTLVELIENLPTPVDFDPKDPKTWVHKSGYGLRFAEKDWMEWNYDLKEPFRYLIVTKYHPALGDKRARVYGWTYDGRNIPRENGQPLREKSKRQTRVSGANLRKWYFLDEKLLISKLQERELSLYHAGKLQSLSFNKLAVLTPLGEELWNRLPADYRAELEQQAQAEEAPTQEEDTNVPEEDAEGEDVEASEKEEEA